MTDRHKLIYTMTWHWQRYNSPASLRNCSQQTYTHKLPAVAYACTATSAHVHTAALKQHKSPSGLVHRAQIREYLWHLFEDSHSLAGLEGNWQRATL